jgi:hypothetical protein
MNKINKFIKIKKLVKKNFFCLIPIYIFVKKILIKNLFFKFIANNKTIIFENTNNNFELLAKNGDEMYIINSSDKFISKELFINGEAEFDKFLKALEIIGNKITKKTLIDIGANIGNLCIPAIKRGIFKNCLAIEPDPYNYSLLKKNIYINDINEKIETLNLAIGSVDNKKLDFELDNSNFGDHRVIDKNIIYKKNKYLENKRSIITIDSKKLDTVIKNFNHKETLIWIDVQGYEAFVLDGANNILSAKPFLVIEFWPYALDRNNSYELLKKTIIKTNYENCYDLSSNVNYGKISEEKFDILYLEYKSEKRGEVSDLLFF